MIRVIQALIVGTSLLLQVSSFSMQMSATKTNVIAGATGYIGKSVVRESVRQGYKTIALVRDKSKVESAEGKSLYGQFFEGAEVVECDVCDPAKLTKVRNGLVFKRDSIFLFFEDHKLSVLTSLFLARL